MFGSMRSGGGHALSAVGLGIRAVSEKLRPNVLFAMVLVAVLGVVVSIFGFKMGKNEAIISGAGVGAIVAIVNLAGRILESEFDETPGSTLGFWDQVLGKIRPNVLIAMFLIASLGGGVSYIAFIWKNSEGTITVGNEAIMAAAGVGAVIAIANLAGKVLEMEPDASDLSGTSTFFIKIRPNILLAMLLVSSIGIAVSILGYHMVNDAVVTAAGVGAIVAVTNLGGKILDVESEQAVADGTAETPSS